MQSIDSCEYIWEAGVGFSSPVTHSSAHDSNRTEILKLLLTCFSQTMYLPPSGERAGWREEGSVVVVRGLVVGRRAELCCGRDYALP